VLLELLQLSPLLHPPPLQHVWSCPPQPLLFCTQLPLLQLRLELLHPVPPQQGCPDSPQPEPLQVGCPAFPQTQKLLTQLTLESVQQLLPQGPGLQQDCPAEPQLLPLLQVGVPPSGTQQPDMHEVPSGHEVLSKKPPPTLLLHVNWNPGGRLGIWHAPTPAMAKSTPSGT
jgi:hypothetical protein